MNAFFLMGMEFDGRRMIAWCIIPAVFLLAIFLPPLLLACLLLILPAVAIRVVSVLSGLRGPDCPYHHPVALQLRGPPAC